ncbi:MAG: hypothetical protein N2747_05510 [Chitinophagaceae bacterium]|nr:hypothetical protein [Chitinophagaceae bacterium]
MALNKNHEFEEINGIRCGIVERDVSPQRLEFLKKLLEHNGYEVRFAPMPPPKSAGAAKAEENQTQKEENRPETFMVGVTDITFNWVNAVFGRMLKTPEGKIVTLAYWKQQDAESRDDIPYFGNKETWK